MEAVVILFHSTNHALWAGKILKNENIGHKMIPVPRHLSSDCGYCIKISLSDIEKVKELISCKGLEYDRFEIVEF